jgi:ribosomal protein S18 acetylase RimI-like enzyme
MARRVASWRRSPEASAVLAREAIVTALLADQHTTGVWLDGRLLGMVRTRRTRTDWHVGRLAVVPDLRGHGLGRWLLRTAEAAADPDIRRIVLFTGTNSQRNINFYQSEGYGLVPSTSADGTAHLTKNVSIDRFDATTMRAAY